MDVPWGTVSADRSVPPSPGIAALLEQVAALASQVEQVPGLPDAQVLADATAVVRAQEQLHALTLTYVGAVHRRQLHAGAGARSTTGWLAGLGSDLTSRDVSLARRMAVMPELAGAVTSGSLPVAGGRAVGQAVESLRRHLDRPDGLIDGLPAEQVLTAVVVDGITQVLCQARGGMDEDDPALADVLCRLWEIAESPFPQLERMETAFLLLAEHVETGALRGCLGQLVDALLPVQLEGRVARGHRKRGLHVVLKPDGSGYSVAGDLDLECGELVMTVLVAAMSTDPANPDDTAAWQAARERAESEGVDFDPSVPGAFGTPWEGGVSGRREAPGAADGPTGPDAGLTADGGSAPDVAGDGGPALGVADDGGPAPDVAGDGGSTRDVAGAAAGAPPPLWDDPGPGAPQPVTEPRTLAQRRHDALKLALRKLLDSAALGTREKAAPHVGVTVGLDALHDAPGALPAVTDLGTRLPRSLTRRLLVDSRLTRYVLGLGRRVLETSHTQRTLTHHERRALHLQWAHGCAEGGCHPPPGTPIVPHHPEQWHLTGTTSFEDAIPFCEQSHHALHVHGRVLKLKDGRWLGPDGWVDVDAAAA